MLNQPCQSPGESEVSYISAPKFVWLPGEKSEISVLSSTVLLSLPGLCHPPPHTTISSCSTSSSSCSSTPVTTSTTLLRNLAACSTYRLLLSGHSSNVET